MNNNSPEHQNDMKFENTENSFFLIGILNAFMNRYQTVADKFFKDISWKQCFVIICIGLFDEPPTIGELSEAIGCSHQNMKQLVLKLEKSGYLEINIDAKDKRKQRISLTEKALQFSKEKSKGSNAFISYFFNEIPPDDLKTTINTIILLDNKLKNINLKEWSMYL